ncbi:ABC transporter ATP-binding protein [Alicyclobacillus sp. ALC3]|uniref:ABC transporter ATP-binding protein n=1 Tax=Alicyclobacillus sp. ALC3 TaxID=2796143 RepID=UPI002377F701|nr:ABC transporter ATP-binding protein [Alicyclobacillus sp. ALC3]WDL97574.1 ABC transporter ATP-binding protein [Alicyclobacillus sp. ALC3]
MSTILQAEGIKKAFGGIQALNGASIAVEEGEIHGLIGPNGSGKTTLFNVITGYAQADAGQVVFRGQQIGLYRPGRIMSLGIGRTFQLTRIFSRLTVLENMFVPSRDGFGKTLFGGWASHADRQRAMELLNLVGIAKLAHLHAGNLSYGQRKLLEIATVMMLEPEVILLDEPAGGVNPTMIGHIRNRIEELNRNGVTFLIVEHNMGFVMELCDHVTVMHRGQTLDSGTPDKVRKNEAVLDAYLGD